MHQKNLPPADKWDLQTLRTINIAGFNISRGLDKISARRKNEGKSERDEKLFV